MGEGRRKAKRLHYKRGFCRSAVGDCSHYMVGGDLDAFEIRLAVGTAWIARMGGSQLTSLYGREESWVVKIFLRPYYCGWRAWMRLARTMVAAPKIEEGSEGLVFGKKEGGHEDAINGLEIDRQIHGVGGDVFQEAGKPEVSQKGAGKGEKE